MDKTAMELLKNTVLSFYGGMCLYLLAILVHGLLSGGKGGKP